MVTAFLPALQATFAERAAHPALVHQGTTFTYGELNAFAHRGASWLQSLGVSKGERVILCTANKLAFLEAHLATLYAGGISLPLNPRFTREELRFFVNDSGARVAVVDKELCDTFDAIRADTPTLRSVVPALVAAQPVPDFREIPISVDDPAMIIYSSGTTGWPKGIVHTHGNLAAGLRALQTCWKFTPDDVVLNVLPLYHVHGLCFATQLTWLAGGCVVLDDFEPSQTLQRLAACTVFMAVPTIYYRLLEEPAFRQAAGSWPNVRLFTCGSAPIRAEVLPELEAILGRPVINRYGMTEAFVITSLPLDGPWPNGSVGLPLDGVELRVAADPGEPKADGEPGASAAGVGSVQIRGPNLFREYWRQPETTQAAFATGWFETGDLGFLDDRGFLTLVGRKNDLIITSGFNVYPQVVERVINSCPGVRESAVLGLADPHKGERVAAAVVRDDPTLTEDRLHQFWSERLVDYQRPKTVVFMDALPRNSMGKVLRRELRDQIERLPKSC